MMLGDQLSYCQARTTEYEQFTRGESPPEYGMRPRTAKKEEYPDGKRAHREEGGDAVMLSPKRSRAKESSKHFGVRFRPDLQKWVAEIRVAEWKSVDKKVWLGTFDSEEGAARAVDAARKLLRCKKRRPPNFPCPSLTSYSERIPATLNLNNLHDESMFKEVTLFVKRKAQEYACRSIQPLALPPPELELDGQWMITSLCSTPCTSPSWLNVGNLEDQPINEDWSVENLPPAQGRGDTFEDYDISETLFLFDDTCSLDEMMYFESQQYQPYSVGEPTLDDWTQQQQQTFNSYHAHMSCMDYTTQVC